MSWVERLAAILPHLAPSTPQLLGLGAVVLVVLALCGLGGLIGGRERLPEADVAVGWGIVTAAFTLVGTVGPIPFTAIAGLLLVASMAAYAVRVRQADSASPAGDGRALMLALPLLLLTVSMSASQWDEFTQWLHGARYLFEYDVFPGRGRPPSDAVYPAYPYAVPLIGYLASRIADHFVEAAIALFNLLLLVAVALLFVRLMRAGPEVRRRTVIGVARGDAPGWGLVALGLLCVTALSPTFVPKLVLTAYAETATAATVAIAGVLGWAALERAAAADVAVALRLALRMGLTLAVLVALKEATLALFGLVIGGVALAAVRRAEVSWRNAAAVVVLGAAPGLVVYAAWRLYVARALPGQEFHVLALAKWNWPLVPAILGAMGRVALGKIGHFALMLAVFGLALRALVRRPGQGRGGIESLAIIAAVVMVGYNAFLFLTYVAVFPAGEAERAASYWRYNTHVGLIGMAVAVCGGGLLWRRFVQDKLSDRTVRALAGTAIGLMIVGPVVLLDHLRFDVEPSKLFVRQVGTVLSRMLPIEARVVVVDPVDPGFNALLVNYALAGHGHVVGSVTSLTPDRGQALRRLIHEQNATYLLAFGADPAVERVTETAVPANMAALLTRDRDHEWRITRTWPMPTDKPRK
jgi:hypothetical protein